ncbi:hypothetical protein [Aquisalimonas asiatica]|uniref:Uncharacterized protein n=1 Tax=Aquisalimonas asiatica TaxID=406100 RepID=A0A1H8VY11_9GAMM|nr:hypothetical protein [Aquisalimonas asiatica]SEP20235.1 hypothetical protein SAMN04488052_1232 [Aquisalimonas asiatica]
MDFAQLPKPVARWWLRMVIAKRARSKRPVYVPSKIGLGLGEYHKYHGGSFRVNDKVLEVPWVGDYWLEVVGGVFLCSIFLVMAYFGLYSVTSSVLDGRVLYYHASDDINYLTVLILVSVSLVMAIIALLVSYYSWLCFHILKSRLVRKGRGEPALRIVFDREKGQVLLPPVGRGEYETVDWEDLVVCDAGVPKPHGGAHKLIKALRPGDHKAVTIDGDWPDREQFWALCCWYMDRSKPLPPDEVFDPYRERDEERRLREFGPEVVRQFPASLTDRRMGGAWRGDAFGIRAEQ